MCAPSYLQSRDIPLCIDSNSFKYVDHRRDPIVSRPQLIGCGPRLINPDAIQSGPYDGPHVYGFLTYQFWRTFNYLESMSLSVPHSLYFICLSYSIWCWLTRWGSCRGNIGNSPRASDGVHQDTGARKVTPLRIFPQKEIEVANLVGHKRLCNSVSSIRVL
jgi:hypothetical protein